MLWDAIDGFDGKDTAALRDAARGATAEDAEALMRWAEQGGRVSAAATWVIKARVEAGKMSGLDPVRLIKVGTQAQDWPTALHLLQLAQHWPAMADQAFATAHLHHPKPMVRTWALDTFARACLAGQGDITSARAEIMRVQREGKPSEQARARALLKLLNRSGGEPI